MFDKERKESIREKLLASEIGLNEGQIDTILRDIRYGIHELVANDEITPEQYRSIEEIVWSE